MIHRKFLNNRVNKQTNKDVAFRPLQSVGGASGALRFAQPLVEAAAVEAVPAHVTLHLLQSPRQRRDSAHSAHLDKVL